MPIVACGVNYKTAPIGLREQLALTDQALPEFLNVLKIKLKVPEIIVLSTCNRTEFYYAAPKTNDITASLLELYQVSREELKQYLYLHQDDDAVRHIMQVACGIDSMLLGEAEIFGQMKRAYSIAKHCGTLGIELHRLFQYIFSMTKKIRRQTGVGTSPVSLAYAAIDLSKRIFADVTKTHVMLIGAGETIELAARYFKDLKVASISVFNRTYSKAKHLAKALHLNAFELSEVPAALEKSDIVVTATSSNLPIIQKTMVEEALKARKHKPILMVDLAIPRDIEPEVASLGDVYLYPLDALQAIISHNLLKRKQNSEEAKHWINLHVEHYMRWVESLTAVNVIRTFRTKIENIADQKLQIALQQLQAGQNPKEVLKRFAHDLSHKFMYQPTVEIRQASYDGDWHLIEFIKRLFQLS